MQLLTVMKCCTHPQQSFATVDRVRLDLYATRLAPKSKDFYQLSTAAVFAQSVKRVTAEREVEGSNPGA